jgi:hypothetical protein
MGIRRYRDPDRAELFSSFNMTLISGMNIITDTIPTARLYLSDNPVTNVMISTTIKTIF